jgi:hypothetical protein
MFDTNHGTYVSILRTSYFIPDIFLPFKTTKQFKHLNKGPTKELNLLMQTQAYPRNANALLLPWLN